MNGLAVRRTSAFFILVALLASITVIGAPGALAQHPEVSASSSCEGLEPVIDFAAESWATGARGSNANIGIYVNGEWQTSGEFSSSNGYSFEGSIDASAWVGQTVTVMARADGPWGNGNPAGDSRAVDVRVGDDCGGTTTTEAPVTTTVVDNPGTLVAGNPSCSDLGYGTGVKDDSPGSDTTIDGITFDYSGTSSVSVSAGDGITIDAVIVKGGNAANVFTSGPFVDLVAPINNGGQQADISHVEACISTPQPTTTTTTMPTTTTTVSDLDASVSIEVGYCREVSGASKTPVTVIIDPAGAATVTIEGQGADIVVDETTRVMLDPGRYSWSAVAAAGYELEGASHGTFRTAECATLDAMVSIQIGTCAYDGASFTEVAFSIAPNGAAQVVIEGPNGPHVIGGSGDVITLTPGEYSWSATAADGYTLVGLTNGVFTIEDCSPRCDGVIGDYVWLDMNPRNGLQDEGEELVEGVVVHLLHASGAVLATTQTDADGHYEFGDLCNGVYRIRFELPDLPGLVNEAWTTQGGGDGEKDSNADVDGLTDEIVVIDGTNDMSWDAGIVGDSVSSTTVTTTPSTSTTVVEVTTTTVLEVTTTTVAGTTSTTEVSPSSTSTTVPPVTATTLPFTGFELQATALLGLLTLAGGAALLLGMRRRPVQDGSDSIGGW